MRHIAGTKKMMNPNEGYNLTTEIAKEIDSVTDVFPTLF